MNFTRLLNQKTTCTKQIVPDDQCQTNRQLILEISYHTRREQYQTNETKQKTNGAILDKLYQQKNNTRAAIADKEYISEQT